MVAVDGFNTCVCADISAHIHCFTKCMGATGTCTIYVYMDVYMFMHTSSPHERLNKPRTLCLKLRLSAK